MSEKTPPNVHVRFTVSTQGNLTLRDLVLFAERLKEIGAEEFLDMPLHGLNRDFRPYVEGMAPTRQLGDEVSSRSDLDQASRVIDAVGDILNDEDMSMTGKLDNLRECILAWRINHGD